jgi:translation initiation factor IF-2
MVKRDDSGSGLRAGFVRGDGLNQQPRKNPPVKPEEPAAKPQPHPVEPPAREPEELSGPTMTMQGVSGKKITGAVKVIKVVKADKPASADSSAEAAVSHDDHPPKPEPAVKPQAEKPETYEAVQPATQVEKPVITEKPAVAEKPAEQPVTQIPAVPVEIPVKPAAPAAQERSQARAPQSERPQSQTGSTSRPQSGYGNRPLSERAPGQGGTFNNRSQDGRGQDNRGQRPYGDRPQGDRPQGDRPQGDRPQGDRGPGSYSPRPYGDRPQGDRPQGDRGPGGYSPRPYGDRPYGDRPQGDRPQGDRGPRPQGDRGPGGYSPRPYGDRPQGDRPQGDRGPGGYSPRPYGDRPQGDRPQGDRGPGGYSPRPYGDRPQGDRPQGDRGPGGYSPRPQGDRGPGGYSPRPQGGRPGGLRIPNVPDELKEKIPEAPRANFAARDAFEKDIKRDDKREPRKDAVKAVPDNKDKHRVLKQQAQALSGQGVTQALSDDSVLDTLYKEPAKTVKNKLSRGGRRPQQPPAPVVRAILTHVKLPAILTVKEFAEAIKKTAAEVIKKLIKFGIMATLNQEIDFDTATIIAEEFGITTEKTVEVTEEEILFDDSEDVETDLKPRPPVVVVMGHVDHGKTSILDRIRSASVAIGEAGGITQHIGAYTVKAKNRQITFLDTPGHEAFTTMRARGAQVTDIAILVVAADDGVMPQTIEAVNHARAANTQIVVALNKIDKEGANIDKVKQELSKLELIPEEWGGSTVMVPVSAKTGQGMDELLEMVLLTADLLDLKANPDKQAKGTVIEAKLDKNRGPVATVLVQRGTLSTGDTLVTGSIIGRVRAMTDDKGNMVKKAGPSIPVEILGLPEVPEAGELFYAVTDEKVARTLAERRRVQQREQQLRSSSRMSLDTLFSQMAAGEVKDLNIIVKADVQGSVEAVRQSLEKLSGSEVRVKVIHGAVGAITESDVRLAEVSNAIVIGFNVRPAANVADLAKDAGVDVRMYRIIYNAIDDIEAAMKGMLTRKFKETVLGHAQVRQVFKVSGVGSVGGCYVTDGKITRSSEVRIVRDGIVIHEGKLASLKRFKDDVREVATGYECGIGIEKFNDIKENDVIEAFEMTEIERS